MAPRLNARPARENDFSNVGKIGRRTGVMLPQGRVDANGMEEITGIFSSPRKPSPLKQSMTVVESIETNETGTTPTQTLSVRKSLPPRSVSPRKSGISGIARRSNAVDLLGQKDKFGVSSEAVVNTPIHSVRAGRDGGSTSHTSSPSKTPLQPSTISQPPRSRRSARQSNPSSVQQSSPQERTTLSQTEIMDAETNAEEAPVNEKEPLATNPEEGIPLVSETNEDDYVLPVIEDDPILMISPTRDEEPELEILPSVYDDEDADQTFELEKRSKPRSREPTIANSRKKRKSDAAELGLEVDAVSSPAAKRAKRISDEGEKRRIEVRVPQRAPSADKPVLEEVQDNSVTTKPKGRGRPRKPLQSKDTNLKLSQKQQTELDSIVEKIKVRPGQKRALYIMRRETPADEGVTHTRSGRISVKPLAYWKNERCVFGGSPGGANLQDGARFPLNSIKEIIRNEEVESGLAKKAKRGKKTKGKAQQRSQSQIQSRSKSRSQSAELEHSETESDIDDDERVDPDAEPWETENGTIRGPVSIWSTDDQAPIEQEEDIDIAHAPGAIETRDVKGASFKYAKLLSTGFLGSGIVELPPGGVKRPKNSRKMHMSFFVATGRVTVYVGPLGMEGSRFSIGKGGFWQVPRGNQYAIENEHDKPARLFFSQACEVSLQDLDDE